mmetsp:Transcript_42476/g.96136  ORF Transcript_42476/g.96136 Transcript_42476/m.96136 type:complete len:277 (-) Transcript_42476:820-1650(-)
MGVRSRLTFPICQRSNPSQYSSTEIDQRSRSPTEMDPRSERRSEHMGIFFLQRTLPIFSAPVKDYFPPCTPAQPRFRFRWGKTRGAARTAAWPAFPPVGSLVTRAPAWRSSEATEAAGRARSLLQSALNTRKPGAVARATARRWRQSLSARDLVTRYDGHSPPLPPPSCFTANFSNRAPRTSVGMPSLKASSLSGPLRTRLALKSATKCRSTHRSTACSGDFTWAGDPSASRSHTSPGHADASGLPVPALPALLCRSARWRLQLARSDAPRSPRTS